MRIRRRPRAAATGVRARRQNARIATAALMGVVVLALIGSVASRRIRSPARIAAETAPPEPSLVGARVERRALATEVIVRGTVRYGAPQEVVLPLSALKTTSSVISRVPKPGDRLRAGNVALVVSGRPSSSSAGRRRCTATWGPAPTQ